MAVIPCILNIAVDFFSNFRNSYLVTPAGTGNITLTFRASVLDGMSLRSLSVTAKSLTIKEIKNVLTFAETPLIWGVSDDNSEIFFLNLFSLQNIPLKF